MQAPRTALLVVLTLACLPGTESCSSGKVGDCAQPGQPPSRDRHDGSNGHQSHSTMRRQLSPLPSSNSTLPSLPQENKANLNAELRAQVLDLSQKLELEKSYQDILQSFYAKEFDSLFEKLAAYDTFIKPDTDLALAEQWRNYAQSMLRTTKDGDAKTSAEIEALRTALKGTQDKLTDQTLKLKIKSFELKSANDKNRSRTNSFQTQNGKLIEICAKLVHNLMNNNDFIPELQAYADLGSAMLVNFLAADVLGADAVEQKILDIFETIKNWF